MAQAPHGDDGAQSGAAVDPPVPPGVDPSAPAPARLYDYYLGGSNNFEADRIAAERLRLGLPELSDAAWANRGFHQRAAGWLAADKHIRQFIDIGAGLPTQGNTHEVVQRAVPDARASAPATLADVPASTPASKACARELRGLGFVFVGPVTVYATFQACGVVDDHLSGCFRHGAYVRN